MTDNTPVPSTDPVAPAATPAPGPSVTNVYVNQGAQGSPLKPKSLGIAYLWWILLGYLGAHQYYLGKTGRGLLYTFTAGIVFIGWFIDLFTLPSQVRTVNARRAVGIR